MSIQKDIIIVHNIFKLASDILNAGTKIKELEVKGEIFLKALQEHEITVRAAMEYHSKETNKIIDALLKLAQKGKTPEERKLALEKLADFSSTAIKELGETSRKALSNIHNTNKLNTQEILEKKHSLPK